MAGFAIDKNFAEFQLNAYGIAAFRRIYCGNHAIRYCVMLSINKTSDVLPRRREALRQGKNRKRTRTRYLRCSERDDGCIR